MGKQAFLIQHIGQVGTAVRARADRVMESIIVPACTALGFTCARADQFPRKTIVEPIVSALASSPMAIADLGSPPWNSNVLMEVGFRIANGKPIVYLSDAEPTADVLPLHLQNKRILKINDPVSTIINLKEYIEEQREQVCGWRSQYPTIDLKKPLLHPEETIFTFANEAAARLYGFDSPDALLSASVTEADSRLKSYMNPEHARLFSDEQVFLDGAATANREVVASVPAWFTNHRFPELNRKPFWPVLLSRKFSPHEDNSLVMRVAFVNLAEWFGPRQPGWSNQARLPELFRPRKFRYDVFLSYNSVNRRQVAVVAEMFRRSGLDVWFDDHELVGRGGHYTEIKTAMSESRIICAVVGRQGLGPWQSAVELKGALLDATMNQRPIAVLLLDGVDSKGWWSSLPPEFDSLKDHVYGSLPPLNVILNMDESESELKFLPRIVRLIANAFKQEGNS